MDLTIKGKVSDVLTKSGEGKNGEWVKNTLILSTKDTKYAVTFFNHEEVMPEEGEEVEVKATLVSNEWKGNYYTDLKGKEFNVLGGSSAKKAGVNPKDSFIDNQEIPF